MNSSSLPFITNFNLFVNAKTLMLIRAYDNPTTGFRSNLQFIDS